MAADITMEVEVPTTSASQEEKTTGGQHIAEVTESGAITWVQFYKALKAGDCCVVNQALPNKNVLLHLDGHDSALNISAKEGHTDVVRLILNCDQIKNLDTDSHINTLAGALNVSCRQGQAETSKIITEALQVVEQSLPAQLEKPLFYEYIQTRCYDNALLSGNVDLVRMLDGFLKEKVRPVSQCLDKVFKFGSPEVFHYLVQKANLNQDSVTVSLSDKNRATNSYHPRSISNSLFVL